jgi:NagD protein
MRYNGISLSGNLHRLGRAVYYQGIAVHSERVGPIMKPVKHYLIDMDGVLVSGRTIIPGADQFIERLRARGAEYLVLTNNSLYTPRDLAHRLQTIGLDIPIERIFTSAMATSRFLHSQKQEGTAFVIGESGLTEAIHAIGYVITDLNPDYAVLGETNTYNRELITKAIRLVAGGAHFIATNPDPSGPGEGGLVPGCGAMAALIESASGKAPFFVGKPNPLMMRTALNYLDVHSEDTVMVGDRMETDIIAGVESGMETVLVLTGVTNRENVARYPYQPTRIVDSVADIEP